MIRFRDRTADLGAGPRATCVTAATVANAGQPQPEDVLKSHGLSVRRGGSTYVLAAESEIQLKLNEAQRIHKQLSSRSGTSTNSNKPPEQRRSLYRHSWRNGLSSAGSSRP